MYPDSLMRHDAVPCGNAARGGRVREEVSVPPSFGVENLNVQRCILVHFQSSKLMGKSTSLKQGFHQKFY